MSLLVRDNKLIVTGLKNGPLAGANNRGYDLDNRDCDAVYRCSIGPAGIVEDKCEGDDATPAGVFPLRTVLYRKDRVNMPKTGLPCRVIEANDGWCDEPLDRNYNRPVKLPYPASAEKMWREDHVYDICVILGHNDDPPVPHKGSAIFFHLAHDDYRETQGCVAMSYHDMLEVLAKCEPGCVMEILIPS